MVWEIDTECSILAIFVVARDGTYLELNKANNYMDVKIIGIDKKGISCHTNVLRSKDGNHFKAFFGWLGSKIKDVSKLIF